MLENILLFEVQTRLSIFLGMLFIVALLEFIFPRRQLTAPKSVRWISNLGITFLNSVLTRLIFPVLAVELAILCQQNSWGIFNIFSFPLWFSFVASILILDFAIYLQHVMFHMVPTLWRLHRMHHTDLDLDVTSGSRFHPIEILLSIVIKLAIVMLLGAPAVAVLIFEIILNGAAMFNHGNINIPEKLDAFLRLFIVTPDMHRIHHSIIKKETNSNFGFNVPWWDRLMGTYIRTPQEGQLGLTIGLEEYRHLRYLNLNWLLLIPFINSKE